MNIKKGIRRISFVIGLIAGSIFMIVYLAHSWRGTSFQEHRNPNQVEIALAKSRAQMEPEFVWYRMLELDVDHKLIPDRSYVEQANEWGVLAKDQYQSELFYKYDGYLIEYMKKHKAGIHGPRDLDDAFISSIYLARTEGVDPEYARTHQETLFAQEAGQYSYESRSQMPWAPEEMVFALIVSVCIFLILWFLPYATYFVMQKTVDYFRTGFD
jgi:hypothetical protein